MLPNLHIPTLHLWKIPIQPFGIMVAIALIVGYMLGRRRARRTGLDPNICADGQVWIVLSGFAVAHWFSVIFYYPERILNDPLSLLKFWAGLSSFGGIVGAILGAVIYFRRMGVSIIKYVDAIIFGFVPAWIFGRMGCTIVFDHPGRPTDFVLGMVYHRAITIDGVTHARGVVLHNLGLYEMLWAVVLTIVLYSVKNIRPFDGFHAALMLLLYAPARFMFDVLRVDDATYLGLTPGQYFSAGMVLLAVVLIVRGRRARAREGASGAAT